MLKWLAGFIAILEDPSSESFWQDFKISLEQKAAFSKLSIILCLTSNKIIRNPIAGNITITLNDGPVYSDIWIIDSIHTNESIFPEPIIWPIKMIFR